MATKKRVRRTKPAELPALPVATVMSLRAQRYDATLRSVAPALVKAAEQLQITQEELVLSVVHGCIAAEEDTLNVDVVELLARDSRAGSRRVHDLVNK